jgi:small subunit ribosomal protein S20
MPVIKSAIKKLRKDRKLEILNDRFRKELNTALKTAKKSKNAASVKKAVSMLDKGVKKHIVHKNKAARLKSSLSKLARPIRAEKTKTKAKIAKKPVNKTPKKTGKTAKKK